MMMICGKSCILGRPAIRGNYCLSAVIKDENYYFYFIVS